MLWFTVVCVTLLLSGLCTGNVLVRGKPDHSELACWQCMDAVEQYTWTEDQDTVCSIHQSKVHLMNAMYCMW